MRARKRPERLGCTCKVKDRNTGKVLRDLSGTVVRITPLPSPGLMGPRKREHSELVFRTRWDDRGKQRHKCSETHEMFQIEIRFIVAYQCFVVFDQSPVVAIDCLYFYTSRLDRKTLSEAISMPPSMYSSFIDKKYLISTLLFHVTLQ